MYRLLLLLLLSNALNAQVLHGICTREIPYGFESEVETAFFNAIKIKNGYAIAPAHSFPGKIIRLSVNGRPATLAIKSSDFALLKIDPNIPIKNAQIANPWTEKSKFLIQKYYDHTSGMIITRKVEFDDASYIRAPNQLGMSGSGVYTENGELVAVAEWLNGFCWNTIHIAGFIELHIGESQ